MSVGGWEESVDSEMAYLLHPNYDSLGRLQLDPCIFLHHQLLLNPRIGVYPLQQSSSGNPPSPLF